MYFTLRCPGFSEGWVLQQEPTSEVWRARDPPLDSFPGSCWTQRPFHATAANSFSVNAVNALWRSWRWCYGDSSAFFAGFECLFLVLLPRASLIWIARENRESVAACPQTSTEIGGGLAGWKAACVRIPSATWLRWGWMLLLAVCQQAAPQGQARPSVALCFCRKQMWKSFAGGIGCCVSKSASSSCTDPPEQLN